MARKNTAVFGLYKLAPMPKPRSMHYNRNAGSARLYWSAGNSGGGPLIAAGQIMGALAGLGAGGAVGGNVGALVGMGVPEYEAKRYEGSVKDSGILLSVHCDDSEWTKEVLLLVAYTWDAQER